MKKILIIGNTNLSGGVGHLIFEICKHLNKEKIHFDFMYYKQPSEKEIKMIKSYGGEFYKVARYSVNYLSFLLEVKRLYKQQSYDIVHVHASTAMMIMYALPAWRKKNIKIIYHGHVANVSSIKAKILHVLFRNIVNKHTEYKIAVSNAAASFMFGRKHVDDTIILKNGIDIKKYEFNLNIRERMRREIYLDEKFVIGHVGRFCFEKNHIFIICIFEKIHSVLPNSRLLLIGTGENMEKIIELVKSKGLQNSVIFYGNSDHVENLLCAMDCFVFPSIQEGLGIAALEAQANGLPVIASDKVPVEVKVTEKFFSLSIEPENIEMWVNKIIEVNRDNWDRNSYYNELNEHGYNIHQVVNQLEQLYLEE